MEQIRGELTDITGVGDRNKLDRWHDPDRFQREVVPILPPSIEVIQLPPGKRVQFNCFAYALGLHQRARPFEDGFIYGAFVEKLLARGKLLKISRQPTKGDVVLYWNGRELKHAGIMDGDDLVVSKWSGGPILRHPLWHVPASYGDRADYFQALSAERVMQLFEKYGDANVGRA